MLKLAITHFEEAQKYGEIGFKSNKIFEAQTLLGIGESYAILKQPNKALFYHQKAYQNIKNIYSLENEKVTIFYALAKDYIELQQNKKAIEFLKRALEISYYKKGEMSPLTVKINNLFSTLQKDKVVFRTSLKNYRLLYGRQSMEVADLYRDMAKQKELKKSYKEALNDYEKAIKIYEKELPLLYTKRYSTYFKMAHLNSKLHQKKDYFNNSIKAFDGFFQNQELIFSTLSSYEKRDYIQKHKNYIVTLFDASFNQSSQQLFNRWLNFKRKLYDEENALALQESKTEDRRPLHRLKKIKRLLAQEYQSKNFDKTLLSSLENEIAKLESKLSLDYFYYKKGKKSIDYKEISRLLKAHELYIDIAKVDKSYYLFILNGNKKIKIEKIADKEYFNLDNLLKIFIEDTNKSSYPSIEEMQYLLGSIYKIVFSKVDLTEIDSLVVSPDGVFNYIPFEALYDQKEKKYLIEELTISYIPSGRELVELSKRAKSSNHRITLFGRSDFKEVGLEKLKYVGKEIKIIQNIYPKAKIFLDNRANAKELLNVNSPKILHLATHGSYKKRSEVQNPLLNIHLYLDRAISGLEISGLNLKGTELVVVSACQTALGKMDDFEGVSSISKAFMEAGAKNTIVSLWSIDDKATTMLMNYFYQALKEGKSYAQALRDAKLILLKKQDFQNPAFWSALIQIGY